MRRIPRLRRPSGLPSPVIITNNDAVSGPSRIKAPFSSARTQRPTTATATRQLYPPTTRLYSSEKTPVLLHATEERVEGLETMELVPLSHSSNQGSSAGAEESKKRHRQPVYKAPPPRIDAAREEEVADPTYVPATVAKGLQTVGGLANWWDNPEHWNRAGDFVGFKARKPVVEPVLLEAAVRRAAIEAFALREVGREEELVGVWPSGLEKEKVLRLLGCKVTGDGMGGAVFGEGDLEVVVEGLRWNDEVEAGQPVVLKVKDVAGLRETWDAGWKTLSLTDPRIRFAVTKRIFQLTGHLIPDHKLTEITTVQTLLHIVQKKPKPVTLTQELQRHETLAELPNVTIARRRVTRGDKEIALGRYKLTQAEFAKRGLPARGHGGADKGKEISRLRGGV
ncbi:ribosomal subunit 39S-domain-containing protein [Xylaria sp. CBS 124048]|nr:ribosomal subunit 39S-domain-containing protein [Xylaria sp. CBS 124048]